MKLRTWADEPMIAFDTETTGVVPETDRIVSAAAVALHGTTAPGISEWLINPGVPIPKVASEVHGFTTEKVEADGASPVPSIAAIVETLMAAIKTGTPVLAFNAAYDLSLLHWDCRRHNIPTITDRCTDDGLDLFVIDPMVIDRACDRYRKGKRTLSVVAEHYGIELPEELAHTAAGDCMATARVAWKISRMYPTVGTMSLHDLMDYQRTAHAEWAENFEEFLRRSGKDNVTISRQWPLRIEGDE